MCAYCAQVFDEKHSDSELWRKLMDENTITYNSGGTAHNQNSTRRKNLVTEQKHNRQASGGTNACQNLEYYCCTQYSRCINETEQVKMLRAYSGQNMHDDGKVCPS